MQEISNNSLDKYGVKTFHQIMDNGELRFRLIGSDKSSYIRTESQNNKGWQNSHYHENTNELYLVGKGKITVAIYEDGTIKYQNYVQNEFFAIEKGTIHNVYMYPDTILHTIKYGQISENDWISFPKLDALLLNYVEIKTP